LRHVYTVYTFTSQTNRSNMNNGDKFQYNKIYKDSEVVTILNTDKDHALIQFPSGTKIATRQSGLWPINKPK
jgi:hypothetical protein